WPTSTQRFRTHYDRWVARSHKSADTSMQHSSDTMCHWYHGERCIVGAAHGRICHHYYRTDPCNRLHGCSGISQRSATTRRRHRRPRRTEGTCYTATSRGVALHWHPNRQPTASV